MSKIDYIFNLHDLLIIVYKQMIDYTDNSH